MPPASRAGRRERQRADGLRGEDDGGTEAHQRATGPRRAELRDRGGEGWLEQPVADGEDDGDDEARAVGEEDGTPRDGRERTTDRRQDGDRDGDDGGDVADGGVPGRSVEVVARERQRQRRENRPADGALCGAQAEDEEECVGWHRRDCDAEQPEQKRRGDDDGAAPDPVGRPTDERRGDDSRHGVDGDDQPRPTARHPERPGDGGQGRADERDVQRRHRPDDGDEVEPPRPERQFAHGGPAAPRRFSAWVGFTYVPALIPP